MKKTLRWVFADLFLHKRFSFLFILNIALGLTGFVALDGFRHQLEGSLNLRSRLVLGADLGLSSRQPLNEKSEKAALEVLGEVPSSKMVETYSMAASEAGDSRLVQIKAIDGRYPFYGAIKLREKGEQKPGKRYDILKSQNVWVYPEVLLQLGLEIGDPLKIGEERFTISDVVEDDSASGFSTSMAPRVYLGINKLDSTGLITEESLAWYSQVFKAPLNDDKLQETVEAIFARPEIDESVRVYSHKNVSEQMSRMLSYLSDYLGLVSIAAIFLASIGAAFLFRSYINGKIKEMAIFRSLGMNNSRSLMIYVWQILFLGSAASLITFLASLALTPLLTSLLKDLVSVPIVLKLRWQGIGIAFLLGTLGSLLIALPMLLQIKDIRPALLFQSAHIRLKENAASFLVHILAFITLWLLAVWQSNSWVVGSSFIGLFLICGGVLAVLAFIGLRGVARFGSRFALVVKLALRNLARQPKATLPCFLALGMGLVLLNIIPQIEASIQTELEQPEKSKLPSFFLFDIQDDQVEEFKKSVLSMGVNLGRVSPMIRARLIEVNGQEFEKANANKESFSREEEREARFRNRGFNLSYREQLDSSEKILQGRPFSGKFDPDKEEMAEISVERRFAGRLGLKIDDVLNFEIQGVPVEAKIVNLRSVRWTSFQPNFFIQFQPGVLEEAPKTHVASIANISAEKKNSVQNVIVKKFPNISIIDVTRIVKRLSEVSQQMSVALQFMALLCLIVGLLVMYSIASHQAAQRRRDINLIKVLGAPYKTIRNLFVAEFAILAALAGFLGILLSVGVSATLSYFLFDGIWSWSPQVPIISFVSLVILVSILAHFSVAKVLRTRASFYL